MTGNHFIAVQIHLMLTAIITLGKNSGRGESNSQTHKHMLALTCKKTKIRQELFTDECTLESV